MASEHDKRYKKLFQNPYFVQKLLESFVHENFVRHLDFTTLTRLDKSFVTEEYREKESDLIYQVKFKGKPVYIFLLIEFQSTVDRFMSLRFLRYITEFYMALHQNQQKTKFPSVFPILLYNGEKKWTAKYQISQLIEKTIPGEFIPKFRYYPVIENTIPKQSLLKIKNALSAVFYAEQFDADRYSEEIENLFKIVKDEKLEMINEFTSFLNNLIQTQSKRLPDEVDIGKMKNIGELKPMLEIKLERYGQKLKAEGIALEKKIIVNTMKNKGFSVKQISEMTDIPETEILTLIE